MSHPNAGSIELLHACIEHARPQADEMEREAASLEARARVLRHNAASYIELAAVAERHRQLLTTIEHTGEDAA